MTFNFSIFRFLCKNHHIEEMNTYCFLLILLSTPIFSTLLSDVVSYQNDRLQTAYIALQAWKNSIQSDPKKITANWVGHNVCDYNGVFCAPSLNKPNTTVVAGVDLNGGSIAGFLPSELGMLADVAVIHLNSNRFSGVLPRSFDQLKLLFELDVSNNRLVGPFPTAVLQLTQLRFLDLRYNEFQGPLPPQLFNMALDALFLNNNRFNSKLPDNFGNSKASVIVLSNNNFTGCIPNTINKMRSSLNEIILSNNKFTGCLPPEMGNLESATVIDVSENGFVGEVADWLCGVGSLRKLVIEGNFFVRIGRVCEEKRRRGVVDDRRNCLPELVDQRTEIECNEVVHRPVVCNRGLCGGSSGTLVCKDLVRMKT